MSYSQETLEKAIKLFNNAKSDLNNRGFATSNLESYLYSLRDKPQKPVGGCTATWIDNDESGDYTPALENDDDRNVSPKRKENIRSSPRRNNGEGNLVTLKLNTPEGREFLSKIARDDLAAEKPNRKYYGHGSSTAWPILPLPKSKTPYQPSASTQSTTTTNPRRSNRISTRNQQGARSTRSLLSLLPGAPETRGCKSCWENYRDCSLLNAPTVYPCQACKDGRHDCDLIIPPKQKRPCENCRKKRLNCSYGENTAFDRPCNQCQNSKTECIAGPAEGHTLGQSSSSLSRGNDTTTSDLSFLQRLKASASQPTPQEHAASSLDPDVMDTSSSNMGARRGTPVMSSSPIGLPGGNSAINTPSPSARRQPARSTRTTIRPKATSHNISGSSPVEQPSGPSRKISGPSRATLAPSRSTLAPKPSIQPERGSQSTEERQITSKERPLGGKSIMIQTRFAHPIKFDHTPPKNGSKPCHWCKDFTYGMLGLGNINVEVVKKPDGPGYVEVRGGHIDGGRERSRMCTVCGLERIHIGNCSNHMIFALKNLDEDTFDFEQAFLSWEPCDKTGRRIATNPWCSLCPNPAFYGCATLQKFNKYREPLHTEEEGCGLLLCSDCAEVMAECNSNIARTVRKHRNMGRELRADVEFLLPHNDLYEAFRARR